MGKIGIAVLGDTPLKEYYSFSLREENTCVFPDGISWVRGAYTIIRFFVDHGIHVYGDIVEEPYVNCALLVEPPHLRPENYEAVIKRQKDFNYIFTYDRKTLAKLDPAKRRFYVLGGSSIAFDKWEITEKTKDVCMFYSGKDTTEGHKLRAKIINQLGAKVDVFGDGVGAPVPSKYDILKHYRYCIVIESGQADYYFTEKLIDPISVGTIPIYWGCPSIGKWFNEFGITPLEWILEDFEYWTTKERYESLRFVQERNLEKAKNYTICEDWMYNTYPEVFNG